MIAAFIDLLICALEAWGLIYFLDTYMECRFDGAGRIIRYFIFYAALVCEVFLAAEAFAGIGGVLKLFFVIGTLVVFGILNYDRGIAAIVFFASTDYILLFFIDGVAISLPGISDGDNWYYIGIILRLIWIALLVFLRRKTSLIKRYLYENRIPWMRFSWLTVFSGFIGIYLYTAIISGNSSNPFYSLVSVGIMFLNVVSLFALQDSLLREEKLYQSQTQILKQRNQMQAFQNLKSVYDRQGRKLHDYKKQMMVLHELIKNGDMESALSHTEQLTESISVELSEINVEHPFVNAILNQEYRLAKGKGISMSFSVCDLSELNMNGEDVVTIFGNLLDNAIQESEKVLADGKNSAIQVKMAQRDDSYIFTVKNPVQEKPEISDNPVVKTKQGEHGIGLVNVREAVDKYNGSFAITCDEEVFKAVVIIPCRNES